MVPSKRGGGWRRGENHPPGNPKTTLLAEVWRRPGGHCFGDPEGEGNDIPHDQMPDTAFRTGRDLYPVGTPTRKRRLRERK